MVNISTLNGKYRDSKFISTIKSYKNNIVLGSLSIVKNKIETVEVDLSYDKEVLITIRLSNLIFELTFSKDSAGNFSKEEDLFIKKIKKEFFEEDEL